MLGRAARAVWGAQRASMNGGGGVQRWRSAIGEISRTMFIQTKGTPNAHAVMFLPGREVLRDGTANFPTLRSAGASPLARQLFAVDGVNGIFFGADFVTVTKNDAADWSTVRPEVFEVLMEFFTDGEKPVISDDMCYESDTAISEDDDEVVAMIKELLETRVKPAVAADGGSVLYRGFEEKRGIVRLELQGACSTCSSSAITLKSGIESMLRHYVPEVKEVVQVVGEHAEAAERASEKALSEMEKRLEEQGLLR